MVQTHPERFGPPFWDFFSAHVAPGIVEVLVCAPAGGAHVVS